MLTLDARELRGHEIESLLPGYGDEALAAAPSAATSTRREPALAHHRLRNARRRMNARRDVAEERGGIGIALEGHHADDAAAFDLGAESAPMRVVVDERTCHGSCSASEPNRSASDRRS